MAEADDTASGSPVTDSREQAPAASEPPLVAGATAGIATVTAADGLAGSPTVSAGCGFAFAGTTDCPTPVPLGQPVARSPAVSVIMPATLFQSKGADDAADSSSQPAAASSMPVTSPQLPSPREASDAAQQDPVQLSDNEAQVACKEASEAAVVQAHQQQDEVPLRPQPLLPSVVTGLPELRSKQSVPDPRQLADCEGTAATKAAAATGSSPSAVAAAVEACLV